MANIAQTVNVLQAMILTDKEKMVRTPTYYAFKMHVPFQDATFIPVDIKKTARYTLGDASVPSVMATAAIGTDKKVYLSLINLDPGKEATISADLKKHSAKNARGEILTAASMDARNTFNNPEQVIPKPVKYEIKNTTLNINLPPKSIVVVTLD